MPTSSSGSQIGDQNELTCCSKCKKIFQDVDELDLHEKKCFVGRLYPCKYPGCGHVNSQKSLLNEHAKGVHENNPFRCDACGETFIYWKSLRKHENGLILNQTVSICSSIIVQNATLLVTTKRSSKCTQIGI